LHSGKEFTGEINAKEMDKINKAYKWLYVEKDNKFNEIRYEVL
jgi:hypothetical protein